MPTKLITTALVALAITTPAHAWCQNDRLVNVYETSQEIRRQTVLTNECADNYSNDCFVEIVTTDKVLGKLRLEENECIAVILAFPTTASSTEEALLGLAVERYLAATNRLNNVAEEANGLR
jgi:hypothetical protein